MDRARSKSTPDVSLDLSTSRLLYPAQHWRSRISLDPFHDNLDGSFAGHMEYPDGSIPTITKASSGRMSPVRSKTVKEFYEQLSELKKENFSLKLRIFYMEERMQQTTDFTKDDYTTANINLKIEVESLKKELGDRAELLKKASHAMENLAVQHQEELDHIQKHTDQDRHQIQEKIHHDIMNKTKNQMAEKDKQIEFLERELDVMRTNVEKLETEKQNTLIELNQRVAQLQSQLPDPKSNIEREKVDLLEIIEEHCQKNSELEVVLEQLSNELTDKDQVIEQLKLEAQQHKDRCEHLNKKLKRSSKGQDALNEKAVRCQELEENIDELRTSLDNRNKLIKDMENRTSQLNLDVESLRNHVTELEFAAARSDKDLLVRTKAIQGLTQEAHARGRENEKLVDRVEELERQLNDVTAELHTHKMSKYDKENSTQRELLDTENYVMKLQGQVSELQRDVKELMSQLQEKDNVIADFNEKITNQFAQIEESENKMMEQDAVIAELNARLEEVQNQAAMFEKQSVLNANHVQDMTSRLLEQDEGLKHLAEKYENEKLAIKQQVQDLHLDIQEKDYHLQLMNELKEKIVRLLEASTTKNETVIESLREEIHCLTDRLPPTPFSSADARNSPFMASAPAPFSSRRGHVTSQHQRHLHDPHMAMAGGPVTTSTPLQQQTALTSAVSGGGQRTADATTNVTLQPANQIASDSSPTYTINEAPPMRPALVGSAYPDAPANFDVTDYRLLHQSQHDASSRYHASFEERLSRMSESDLRAEIRSLLVQLANAKDQSTQLQRRLDNLVTEHLIQLDDRQRHSPNRASDIIKRLKLELETSKSRLREAERLNSLLMQSGNDSGLNRLKNELSTSLARLHDQSQTLAQKDVQLKRVTWLVERVRHDFDSLDSQLSVVCRSVRTSSTNLSAQNDTDPEFNTNLQAQLNELQLRLREKCAELNAIYTNEDHISGESTDAVPNDFVIDNRNLYLENYKLREKLGIDSSTDLDTVPNVCDLNDRLVQITEQLNRMQTSALDGLSPRTELTRSPGEMSHKTNDSKVNDSSDVDNLVDEIIALREENEQLKISVAELKEKHEKLLPAEFASIETPSRVSNDVVQRHHRQIEKLHSDLDTERQHNKSLMDVINTRTPNGSFAQGQGHNRTRPLDQELRRAAMLNNATRTDVTSNLNLDDVNEGADVVARLDDVCRLLCEILLKQENLSGHEASRDNDDVTVEYLSQVKTKLTYMLSVVQSLANTIDASLDSTKSPEKSELDSERNDRCARAEYMSTQYEDKCTQLEDTCTKLSARCEEFEKFLDNERAKCQELSEEIGRMEELEKKRCAEFTEEIVKLRNLNEVAQAEYERRRRAESELQSRVRELEGELSRSLDDNNILRADVTNTQQLLSRAKDGYGKKAQENQKLKQTLDKNEQTIKQCTESITSVHAMVKEKDDMIRLLKEKCKRLQRASSRPQVPVSTGSEDDDVTKPARHRPRRSRTNKLGHAATHGTENLAPVSDLERLRHHTGSSQSLVLEDRVYSPGCDVTASPPPLPCVSLPLSDNSESVYEHEFLAPGPRLVSVSPGDKAAGVDVDRLRCRLRTAENMNETLRAELMLYQHLSQTLTSSAGSTPNLASRNDIRAFSETNASAKKEINHVLVPNLDNSRPNAFGHNSAERREHAKASDINGDQVGGNTLVQGELAVHLKELRRLRVKLEETIALNDDLTRELNEKLKQQRGLASGDHDQASHLIRSLRHQVDLLHQDLADSKLQLHQMTEEAVSYRADAERAQLEYENQACESRKQRQETEILRDECDRLEQKAQTALNECLKVQDECTKLKDESAKIKNESTRLKDESTRMRGDCDRLRKECEWRRDENKRLEDDGRILKDELDLVKSESRVLKERISENKMRGSGHRDLDLTELVEEIGRLRVQLERSISTNQELRHKLEEMISKGGTDSLSSSLKKLLRQSDALIDIVDERSSRTSSSGRLMAQELEQAYHYPPDSSDSGTCTGNRSRSNSHSSTRGGRRRGDDVTTANGHPEQRHQLAEAAYPRMRRAVSAMSLTESRGSRDDVIPHCGVINDDEHILSVSMLAEDEDQRRQAMRDFEMESRDDYLLLPPDRQRSLHHIPPPRPQYPAHFTRSVDDLRHIGDVHVNHVTRLAHSFDEHRRARINSDLRFLFAIGRLDDYELTKKQLGESQVIGRGIAARIQASLHAHNGLSLIQRGKSAEYNTLRELSTSIDNLLYCLQQASAVLYQFWTSQLPPRDCHGNYVDVEGQRENFELKSELRKLKGKYGQAMQTMKSAQKRLQKANKRKEDMEEAIYRQLSQTERVVRQARINMEIKTGVTAADVLARRQNNP